MTQCSNLAATQGQTKNTPEEASTQIQAMCHLLKHKSRKDSNGSVQTKASENSNIGDIGPLDCEHTEANHERMCSLCGVYLSGESGFCGVKTQLFMGGSWTAGNLRWQSHKFLAKQVSPLEPLSRDMIQKVSSKFGFGLSTQALGVYIFHTVFQSRNQFVQLAVSLFTASKLLEHTTSKALRRYRRYLNKCFSNQLYVQMESLILDKMGFDLQVPTFMDFLLTYLHQGVCEDGQDLNASEIENALVKKAKQVLFLGEFMKFQPQMVAASLLYQTRKEAGLEEPWGPYAREISGLQFPFMIQWK